MAELNKDMDLIIGEMDHDCVIHEHNEFAPRAYGKIMKNILSYADQRGLTKDASINAAMEAHIITNPEAFNVPGLYDMSELNAYLDQRKGLTRLYESTTPEPMVIGNQRSI